MAKAKAILIDQEFVSDNDDEETKTTWIYRTLTGAEQLMVYNEEGRLNHGKVLEMGLIGWRDFFDKEGNQLPFSVKNLGKLNDAMIVWDIALEIVNQSAMTEDERKNLKSQSL